jgi:predicted nucleotidyltransferase
MELAEKLQAHREDILRAAERRGARNVRVFGSVARGEAGPESDVDFLVEFEPGRNLLDWGGLWSELEEILGCEIDVVSEDSIHPLIRERVLKEAVPL